MLVESSHVLKVTNVVQGDEGREVWYYQHSSKNMQPGQFPPTVVIKQEDGEFCPCRLLAIFAKFRTHVSKRLNWRVPAFFVHEDGSSVRKEHVLCVLCNTQQAANRFWYPQLQIRSCY